MTEPTNTNDWPLSKLIKHTVLPKPKGSPKAGGKEYAVRAAFGLCVLGLTWLFGVGLFARKELPGCGATNTTALVERVVNQMPLVQAANLKFVSLKSVQEQGYNADKGLRSCAATLITTAGEDTIQYSVEWGDADKTQFRVEARIQP